jgi:hypothetical protein
MKGYLLKKEFFVNSRKDQIKEHFDFLQVAPIPRRNSAGSRQGVYQARQKTFPHSLPCPRTPAQ